MIEENITAPQPDEPIILPMYLRVTMPEIKVVDPNYIREQQLHRLQRLFVSQLSEASENNLAAAS